VKEFADFQFWREQEPSAVPTFFIHRTMIFGFDETLFLSSIDKALKE